MLIESLLVGVMGGLIAYASKIVYDSNKIELDPVVEVDNIVKYEYHPVDNFKQIGLKDKNNSSNSSRRVNYPHLYFLPLILLY